MAADPESPGPAGRGAHRGDAWLVIGAGIAAALHVGKLAPAIEVLRTDFGLGLGEAGLLLSMVQLAGMSAGVFVGAWIDGIGSARSLRWGACVLAAASVAGALAPTAPVLLALRAVEGAGFLLTVLAAPSLLRSLVRDPARRPKALARWGMYMPVGVALALALGPLVIGTVVGWRGWWVACSIASAVVAVVLALRVRDDGAASAAVAGTAAEAVADVTDSTAAAEASWLVRLRETLSHRGPWLLASCFAVYSSQWLAVVGFMPTVYAQAGITAAVVGLLTALVSLANAAGNLLGAALLHRGHPAPRLIAIGFVVMALACTAAYAQVDDASLPLAWRYVAVFVFSLVGGLVPSSLFALSAPLAPSERSHASTVGWMQQWSAVGQFAGPPLVGWLAGVMGGWQMTWVACGALSVIGLGLSVGIRRCVARRAPRHE